MSENIQEFQPYYVHENEIHVTDGVVDDLVHKFDTKEIADVVCKLLNETYNYGFKDGYNFSLKEKVHDLRNQLTVALIKNQMLEKKLKQFTQQNS